MMKTQYKKRRALHVKRGFPSLHVKIISFTETALISY